jgi:hypothetical protein
MLRVRSTTSLAVVNVVLVNFRLRLPGNAVIDVSLLPTCKCPVIRAENECKPVKMKKEGLLMPPPDLYLLFRGQLAIGT